MGLWNDYKQSLKPLDVEEPIDVYVHRPLGFVVAKSLLNAPVSPNFVTLISIVLGLLTFILMVIPGTHHAQSAGACLFLSAIFDCADGQLARLRRASSVLGRMLDGVADAVVIGAAVTGGTWFIWIKYQDTPFVASAWMVVVVLTVVTGSFHTSLYDHYKNLYLRLTNATYGEGDDLDSARTRYEDQKGSAPLYLRLAWPIYLMYLKSQREVVRRFDPFTCASLDQLPGFSEQRRRIYQQHARGLMKLWRSFFGVGSLVFGLSVAFALQVPEIYVALRLVLLNALFYGYMRRAQRKASHAAFEEMGLRVVG